MITAYVLVNRETHENTEKYMLIVQCCVSLSFQSMTKRKNIAVHYIAAHITRL